MKLNSRALTADEHLTSAQPLPVF